MKAAEKKLNELAAQLESDNPTPQLAEQATQLVFGSGNPEADIVFIGEAPGKNEDLKGIPFVGAAGKFLDEMLAAVSLARDDIYITNIVKYRPPNNRDPEPEEKTAMWPYLLKQLAIIKPKIIATLGRHSGQAFLPDLRISADHGQPKRLKVIYQKAENDDGGDVMQGEAKKQTESQKAAAKGVSQASTQQHAARDVGTSGSSAGQNISSVIILPLYHPAAALYNGGLRETLLEDFQIVPKLLQESKN